MTPWEDSTPTHPQFENHWSRQTVVQKYSNKLWFGKLIGGFCAGHQWAGLPDPPLETLPQKSQ